MDSQIIQGNLFDDSHSEDRCSSPLVLPMTNADVSLYQDMFSQEEGDRLFHQLLTEIPWRQENITLYGRTMPQPRKTSWHGDEAAVYSYSGIRLEPNPWTPSLLEIKQQIEAVARARFPDLCFNGVLLNLYRHGQDSMSWHSDDEPELGKKPIIGSVSFGETRRFIFRYRQNHAVKTDVNLTHGSFLLMAGETQQFWQHAVPKTTRAIAPRINLTFRVVQQAS